MGYNSLLTLDFKQVGYGKENRRCTALVGSARVLRAADTGTWSVREANVHLKESRAVLRQIKKELLAKRRKGPVAMRTVKL